MAYNKDRDKEINIEQVVRYLTNAFSKATHGMGRATRHYVTQNWKRDNDGHFTVAVPLTTPHIEQTKLYGIQVNFAYMINDIQTGPKYLIPKVISDCNRMIDSIVR